MTGLVLASGSATRKALLDAAGVSVTAVRPLVDEGAVKKALRDAGVGAADAAVSLAESKALRVAADYPQALVIGSDQMLDCEGRWFDKPDSPAAARNQLLALRGRSHRLCTGVAVAAEGRIVWRHVEEATLTVRPFSDAFLDRYLEQAGSAVLGSVGAYQLEGLGAQLFERVSGDHFTILGLPLLPLLDCLRRLGALPT